MFYSFLDCSALFAVNVVKKYDKVFVWKRVEGRRVLRHDFDSEFDLPYRWRCLKKERKVLFTKNIKKKKTKQNFVCHFFFISYMNYILAQRLINPKDQYRCIHKIYLYIVWYSRYSNTDCALNAQSSPNHEESKLNWKTLNKEITKSP